MNTNEIKDDNELLTKVVLYPTLSMVNATFALFCFVVSSIQRREDLLFIDKIAMFCTSTSIICGLFTHKYWNELNSRKPKDLQ